MATFVESIHQAELKLLRGHYGPLKRLGMQIQLLFLYIGYAAYSAWFMLFSSSRTSFTSLYHQDQQGTWAQSYDDHIHLQRGLRLFSLSSLCVIVLSSVVIFSIVEFVFPPSATFFAQAADNTYTVTTSANSGSGSLRTAINNANGSTGSVEIVLNIVDVDKTIELVTALPTLTKPVEFTTQQLMPVVVDGELLAPGTDCFEIAAGAEGTTLVGMGFRYCPGNDLVVSAASGITIGGDVTTEYVYVSGAGESGLIFGASNSTIMGVTAGYPVAVNLDPHEEGNALYGIHVTGDNNTLTNITSVQNAMAGIFIDAGAEGNTMTSSFIGVRAAIATSGLGNDSYGIFIAGDNTMIGGTMNQKNSISNNGGSGVYISNATGVQILSNNIGVDEEGDDAAANGSFGIEMSNADSVDIGWGGSAGNGNTIANNSSGGMQLTTCTTATIRNNEIYTNTGDGITVVGGSDHIIAANRIGTDLLGTAGLGNTDFGISLSSAATDILVGGSTSDEANMFADNTNGGVQISGSGSVRNFISQNHFSNQTTGKAISVEDGAQQSILTPVITGAGSELIHGMYAEEHGVVQIYLDGVYFTEGRSIDASGEWSVSNDFTSEMTQSIMALSIDALNNTSEFSDSAVFTTEPRTLTVTDSATFINTMTVEAELDGGGTLYYTLDGSTPTVSSTSSESPLSLTVDETTTMNIFGTDINGNDTNIQTETYTKESDSDSDDGDGGSDDNDGDNDNGEGDNTGDDDNDNVDASRFSYLKPTNMLINGQPVYEADKRIFVPRNKIHIVGTGANEKDRIRLIIKNSKDISVDSAWEDVEDQTWRHTVSEPLQKGKVYSVNAKAQIILPPQKESAVKTLATIVASHPAPHIATLTGDVTVTTQPEKLVFGGAFQEKMDAAVFKIQDQQTGQIVNECRIDDAEKTVDGQEGACTLTDTLTTGQYRVLFHSLDHQLLSAPDFTQLVVTPAVDRSVLNTDERNTDFDYRITTSANPLVVGLGPEGALARVYLNGELVGEATYISAIGWQYALDLSSQSRGKDYLLALKFFHPESGKEYVDAAISYAFHYGYTVVQPVVHTSIPAQVVVGTVLPIDIGGGAGNTVRVYDNHHLIAEQAIIDNITGATGMITIDLPTVSLGEHTVTVQTEDFIGLNSTVVSVAYTVISRPVITPPTEQTPSTVDEEENGDQETPGTPPSDATDEDDEDSEQTNTDTGNNSNDGDNGNANSNSDSPNDGEAEIPDEWKTPVTNPQEQVVVKERLNQYNSESLNVSAEVQVQNAQGEVIDTIPVEHTVNTPTVLTSQRVIGLKPLNFLGLGSTVQDSVVTFSGQTDPYAEVRLTIHSNPIVQVTRADVEGKWTMTVPVSVLPPGDHTASVQTTSRGVTSDEVQIAQFVVMEQSKMSNTTWIFIINIAIAMIVLLVSIAMQIRYRGKRMANYTTPPIAARSTDTGARSDAAQIQSIAQASEQHSTTISNSNTGETEKPSSTHHSPLSE
ncbi:MAG: right-handed parallel beta-helix repeat-containing protein [Candidatus Kerfeldbacteria bacterium]|nr:right-handed parallel beta-helix repeat-containing protein [Candidatus Kerfeldbacteria bacterium]